MDPNTYRDEDDTDHPDSYWRRRVIALVAGLSLLGILAWAFSGGGGKPGHPAAKSSPTAGVSSAAAYSGLSSPSKGQAGSASPGAVTGRSRASGLSPTHTSSSGIAAHEPRTRASRSAPTPAAGAAASRTGPGGTCSAAAVVLSLFTSRPDYSTGQDPAFSVDAVSTASGPCLFNTSPEKLYVVVMSSGRVIWDSADCAHGPASRVADLRRGVPAQESVSWNRTISLPGCVTLASAARAGTYQVQARTATVASPVRTFKLVRLLVAAL